MVFASFSEIFEFQVIAHGRIATTRPARDPGSKAETMHDTVLDIIISRSS
jgi:hypothetical protein